LLHFLRRCESDGERARRKDEGRAAGENCDAQPVANTPQLHRPESAVPTS